jgi:predicted ATPase
MVLKAENLGHLKEAQIDLSKDLIVLCGTNNSGKTYMAYSVFGLYRIANNDEINDRNYTTFLKELDSLFEQGYIELDIVNFYSENQKDALNLLSKQLNASLSLIFGTNEDTFLNAHLDISSHYNEQLFLSIAINKQLRFGKNILIELSKKANERILLIKTVIEGERNGYNINDVLASIRVTINQIFYNTLFNNIYIAPAERTAINIFSKELSIRRNSILNKLVDITAKSSKYNITDFLNREASRYSLPIKESLEIAEDLKHLQSNKSDFSYFADAIEKEILGGKVKISREGEIEFSPNVSKNKGIEIHLTGSMVKSLSSLVFYFRHLAQKNDFIIIDEPELNLHPDNQRKVAKLIVRFINAGFKVMISTHSDFIIRELNILMMLNSAENKTVADKLVKHYKYAQDELLDYNKVGAYLFDNNKNTAIEVTSTGFEVSTIDKEAIQQNDASQDIFLKLYNN